MSLDLSPEVRHYLATRHALSGRRKPRTTYFARAGRYIKVGCASDVNRRIAALNSPSGRAGTAHPADLPITEPLVLLGTVPGGIDTEFAAHCALVEHAAVGEWFHATPEVLAWIAGRATLPTSEAA